MLVNAGAPGINVQGIDLAPRHTRECQKNKQSTMMNLSIPITNASSICITPNGAVWD